MVKIIKIPVISTICIVVPCYNEQYRISPDEFGEFLNSNPAVLICFVNDGSSDNTHAVLKRLKKKHQNQIHILSHKSNTGKAEAVRTGIKYCNENFSHLYIGYLDVDLSTTLDEFIRWQNNFKGEVSLCFGSRVAKTDSLFIGKTSRIPPGKYISTIISNLLRLKIKDTHYGSKLFTKELSEMLFKRKFISKWLFEVELFYRMIIIFGRKAAIKKMIEIPIVYWNEKANSTGGLIYFFTVWYDLYEIRKYTRKYIEI